MDQPILLLKKNPDGKWTITQEAERQLESMDMLIGVISIAGTYPTFYTQFQLLLI